MSTFRAFKHPCMDEQQFIALVPHRRRLFVAQRLATDQNLPSLNGSTMPELESA